MFLHRESMHAPKSPKEVHNFFLSPYHLYVRFLRNIYTYMWTRIYLQKEAAGASKYCWKSIMQLHWTVVTYLLKNIEHGIKHDIDSTYGNIRLYVPEIYSRFDE